MNIDIASIKDLGIPTIFVIFGLFLLGLTFIDLSRSEGKLQFRVREKYPWPLGITAVILIVAGIALILTGFNPDALIQESLENATATINSLEMQIAEQKSAHETQAASVQSAYETQKAIAQSAIPTGTIVAMRTQLADAQATSTASGETLVALRTAQTGEVGALLETISAQATEMAEATPKVITATPSPTETPPQALIAEMPKFFLTTHEMLLKPKEIATPTLDDRFDKSAKYEIEAEINTIQNAFIEIKDPNWEVDVETYDLVREKGRTKLYNLTANHKIRFDGKCPNEETFRVVEVEYTKSVIRASITENYGGQVTEGIFNVYNVSLDHVEQGQFCN